MKTASKITRYILCAFFSFMIYREAGIFTAIFCVLIFLNIEVSAKWFAAMSDKIMMIAENKENPFVIPEFAKFSKEQIEKIEKDAEELKQSISEIQKTELKIVLGDDTEPHKTL